MFQMLSLDYFMLSFLNLCFISLKVIYKVEVIEWDLGDRLGE